MKSPENSDPNLPASSKLSKKPTKSIPIKPSPPPKKRAVPSPPKKRAVLPLPPLPMLRKDRASVSPDLTVAEDVEGNGKLGDLEAGISPKGEDDKRKLSSILEQGSGQVKDPDSFFSSSQGDGDRMSLSNRMSLGDRMLQQNSTGSCQSNWNNKLKVTSPQPFKLRTEQRGRLKEEELLKKMKEMIMEEKKKRIPVAQGLPWTTEAKEVLVKPPVKESTEPIDLVLHSGVRAVERAVFDNYINERTSFAEQLKSERERQQKLEEEDKLARLRKELVPKALPMPYFDRPFVPKRSARPLTVPKEPIFHNRPKRPCCCGIPEDYEANEKIGRVCRTYLLLDVGYIDVIRER